MRKFLLLFRLIILESALLVLASPEPKNDPVYRPISSRNYEAAFGIKRRAEEKFSGLEPSDQAELVYGRPEEDDKLLLAHMKLYASNGLNIVLMERFDHLTRSVDCNGLDGLMSLSFKTKDAFGRALGAWSFINDEEDSRFLLIADHEDCSPSDQRQPYIISKIREDSSTLTTFLTARAAPWSDIASDFEMKFGHAMPKKKSLLQRGIGTFLRTGNHDFKSGVIAKINAGTPGEKFTIVSGGPPSKNNKIECIDCYILGSVLISGNINVRKFQIDDFVLNVSPQDFEASLEFEVTLDRPESVKELSYEKKLVNLPIPDAGIVVKDVFELGLRVQYVVGYTTKLKDGAVFKIGAKAKIPGTPKIAIDGVDYGQSTAAGFEDISIEPIFDLVSISRNTLDFGVATKPKLIFGVDIVKIGHLDISLLFNLPELKGTLTPTFGSNGACSEKEGTSKAGIKVQSKIDLELDLKIDGQLGEATESTQLWEMKLWNKDHDFYKKCFPLGFPGLTHKNPPGSKPAVPQHKPVPSGVINRPSPSGGFPLAPSGGFKSPPRPGQSGAVHNPLSPPFRPAPSGAVHNSPSRPGPSGAVHNPPFPPFRPGPSGAVHNSPSRPGPSGAVHNSPYRPSPSGAVHNSPYRPGPSGAVHNPPSTPHRPIPSGATHNQGSPQGNPNLHEPVNNSPSPPHPIPSGATTNNQLSSPKGPTNGEPIYKLKPEKTFPQPKAPVQKPKPLGKKLYPTGGESPTPPTPSSGPQKRAPYPVPEGWLGLYGII